MKIFKLNHLVLMTFLFFPFNLSAQFTCDSGSIEQPESTSSTFIDCADFNTFDDYDIMPPVTIFLNFHFVKSENNGGNFHCNPNGDSKAYAPTIVNEIINLANEFLTDIPNNLTTSFSYDLPTAKIKYELYSDPSNSSDNCGGIWFYDDIQDFNSEYDGIVRDIIFFDDVNDLDDWGGQATNPLRITNMFHHLVTEFNPSTINQWKRRYARLINHEMGHSLSLINHSWCCNNACAGIDLDVYTECDPINSGNCANCLQTNSPCVVWNPQNSDGTPASNNLMGWSEQTVAITPCQWSKIFKFMMENYTENPTKYISWANDCTEFGEDIIIESGTHVIWDTPKFLNSTVEIQTGATLTITCEVRMADTRKIKVNRGAKLIVDGGKITNLCKDKFWGGIEVLGNPNKEQPCLFPTSNPSEPCGDFNTLPNTVLATAASSLASNDAGVAVIVNEAVIEFAKVGISTNIKQNGGGLILVKDSHFRNNAISINLGRYAFDENKSRIYNTTFDRDDEGFLTGHKGIRIADTGGTKFNLNKFESLSPAIQIFDGGAIISDANYFLNNNRGIEIYSTHPMVSNFETRIGEAGTDENLFEGGESVHIVIEAATSLQDVLIQNNEFLEGSFGIWAEGECKFTISHNSFSKQKAAIVTWETLEEFNDISCNSGFNLEYGGVAFGNNSKLQFTQNDFQATISDLVVSDLGGIGLNNTGIIRSQQGQPGEPADNCFGTGSHIQTLGVTEFFNYFVPEQPTSCITLPSNTNNFNFGTLILNDGFEECQDLMFTGGGGNDLFTKNDYYSTKNDAMQLEDELTGNPNDMMLQSELLSTNALQKQILRSLLSDAINSNNFSDVEEVLQGEGNSGYHQRLLYGVKIQKGDFIGALNILNSISIDGTNTETFKDVQQINLQRLEGEDDFELTPQQGNWLKNIAFLNPPGNDRAFVRALLARYGDIEFPLEFFFGKDGYKFIGKQEDEVLFGKNKSGIEIFPNPAKDQLTLSFSNGFEEERQITLFDVHGQEVSRWMLPSLQSQSNINLSKIPSGLYFISIQRGSQVILQDKLIINK